MTVHYSKKKRKHEYCQRQSPSPTPSQSSSPESCQSLSGRIWVRPPSPSPPTWSPRPEDPHLGFDPGSEHFSCCLKVWCFIGLMKYLVRNCNLAISIIYDHWSFMNILPVISVFLLPPGFSSAPLGLTHSGAEKWWEGLAYKHKAIFTMILMPSCVISMLFHNRCARPPRERFPLFSRNVILPCKKKPNTYCASGMASYDQ